MVRKRAIAGSVIAAMGLTMLAISSGAHEQSPALADAEGLVNVIDNGTFDAGHAPWWNSGFGAFDTSDAALCIVVPEGGNPWDSIVGLGGVPLIDGTEYTLSFDMRASEPVTGGLQFHPLLTGGRTLNITEEWTTFRVEATANLGSASAQGQIQLRLGGNDAEFEFCLDNVSLLRPALDGEIDDEWEEQEEIIPDSGFDEGAGSWWVSGTGPIDVSSGSLCVYVPANPGGDAWERLIGLNEVVLMEESNYRLRFTAEAELPDGVDQAQFEVAILPADDPQHRMHFSRIVTVTNDGLTQFDARFNTFGSELTDPESVSALHFRLGGLDFDFTVCLDDISLQGPVYTYQHDTGPAVKVNQLGYLPDGPKNATVVTEATDPLPWALINTAGTEVATGQTVPRGIDASSAENVHTITFSDYATSGTNYRLRVDGEESHPFAILDGLYSSLRDDSLVLFYTNRSGIEIDGNIIGSPEYSRPAGHLDVAPNQGDFAVGCQDPQSYTDFWTCDYTLDVTGGWYDAGDHGKYVVNGGIATFQLMNIWERVITQPGVDQSVFDDGALRIPANERGNGIPDLLDEARWNLDFMVKMQVPEGQPLAGMAHHKINDVTWTPLPTLPHEDPERRQLYRPSTAATLNLVAVAAQGSRLFEPYDADYAAELLEVARTAWDAALENPDLYAPPEDGLDGGGPYDDTDVTDEFYWAAVQLYLTTGESEFEAAVLDNPIHREFIDGAVDLYWGEVAMLGIMDLARFGDDFPGIAHVRGKVTDAAEILVADQQGEAFGHPYAPEGYEYAWGSNSSILSNQVILATAFDLTGDARYSEAVLEGLDYLLGRNVLGLSYVTGYGTTYAQNQHSRWYANQLDDSLPHPPPGTISGGPNTGLEDSVAAQWLRECVGQWCYVDHINAWSVNELTINWNSVLAWVMAFVSDHGEALAIENPAPSVTFTDAEGRDISDAALTAGDEITVRGAELAPDAAVSIVLEGVSGVLFEGVVGSDGGFVAVVTLPGGLDSGGYVIRASVEQRDGTLEFSTGFSIAADDVTPPDDDEDTPGTDDPDDGDDPPGVGDPDDGELPTTGAGSVASMVTLAVLMMLAGALALRRTRLSTE